MTFIALLLENLLAFYLTYLLAFDLAFYLAYLLTFYLAYLLAYLLAFDLAFYLAYLLAYLLTSYLAFYVANLLAFYLANILALYLAYLLAFHLAYLLAFYLAYLLAYVLAYLVAFHWHIIWQIFWHSIWQTFWHFIWHIFWHIFWHSIWHFIWHSMWHIFWHSIWHMQINRSTANKVFTFEDNCSNTPLYPYLSVLVNPFDTRQTNACWIRNLAQIILQTRNHICKPVRKKTESCKPVPKAAGNIAPKNQKLSSHAGKMVLDKTNIALQDLKIKKPPYRDLTKSCLSHSFRFPRLWTQHQEDMPKSCLLVFPHCERKRQNSPFQIGTFHFPFFFLPALAIQYFLFAHFLPQTGLSVWGSQ